MRNWKSYYLSLAPYLVLALSLAATALGWVAIDRVVDERVGQRFSEEADATTRAIETRLRAYELMLRGGLGLFIGSDDVTRGEFKSYVDILSLQQNYPGVQAFGYIQLVTADGKATLERETRAEGFPEYVVYPPGARETYAPILYIEPLNQRTRRALGYDVLSEETRRAALVRARDSGEASITARIRLVQEPQDAPQPGFSMFLPFFRGGVAATLEERRARIAGFVYAPFRMYDLMNGILAGERALASFTIYDGGATPDRLMYDRALPGADEGSREAVRSLSFGGRDWTLRFTDSAAFRDANDSLDPQAILVGGGLVSLILFVLTLLLRRMLIERRQAAETMVEAERKLAQAQKMEAIGHLTGGVAHDFNNLLQVILGNNDLLVEELVDRPELRAMAEMSRSAAERGAELTHRLLSFARKQTLDPKPVDVNRLVDGMDALLRRTLGTHVTVETALAGGLWRGLLDAGQMESAILNLCLNARDAMPDGGRVVIETANATLDERYAAEHGEVAPGEYVMVAVSDSGVGMDAQTAARAFEPFFTTKEVGKGSGLGLSMVYGFAKQSKGHVKIQSEPGRGTVVRLYLPRAVGETFADMTQARSAAPRGNEKILMVEDDDLVRAHVAAQLRGLGYRVVSVGHGAAAVEALRRSDDYDLLFTDMAMPGGINGAQLAAQARSLRPNLRVLFTTGYADGAAFVQERSDGATPLLRKPYRRDELARKLREVLDAPSSDPS
ncbi:MAG TPA: CHASE domain-containing protein [Alphaproteobacteria bacterium]|nr:CHASE domain-containing protein [Alphaproteobacteria bacterium]